MTEDQIIPTCKRLLSSIKADDESAAQDAACALLAGFLTDVNRIARFTQQIAEKMKT